MKAMRWREQLAAALRATDTAPSSATEEKVVNSVLETTITEMEKEGLMISLSTGGRDGENIRVYRFDDDSAVMWINYDETGKWCVVDTTMEKLRTEEGMNEIASKLREDA